MNDLWTPSEDKILIRSVALEGLNFTETAEKLDGRTRHSVRHRWNRIKHMLDASGEYAKRAIPIEAIPVTTFRACVFDIECMDFKSDGYQDHLACVSFLPLEEGAEVYTIKVEFKDDRSDKDMLAETLSELAKYDIVIGHNVAGFDLNWLYSRAMYYGMKMPKDWLYYDTYQVAKTMAVKSASKSLAGLCAYFGIDSHKTSVQKTEWTMVDSPVKAEYDYSMGEIVTHCENDVKANRELFNVLWQYDGKRSLKRTKW